jgi:AcrR family transcriptional regulator
MKKADKSRIPRRRSPKRKRRSEVEDSARVPVQERSRARFEAILDATDRLLQNSNVENISLYDIAREAGMAAASVHYLFPDVDAVYVTLAERYMRDFALLREKHRSDRRSSSWQKYIRDSLQRSCKQYNDNRGKMELLLGPRLGRKVELEDIRNNDTIADIILGTLNRHYRLPALPHLNRVMSFGITISDAFWSRAYIQHGSIDDDTLEESIRAHIAYLQLYFPESLPSVD